MSAETHLTKIAVFKGKQIRKAIYKNEWWFSVIDVVEALTGTERPRKYWNDLKKKLIKEGYVEVSEKIGQLKLRAADGKEYLTDCASTETVFRIIQTVPSPKGLERQNLRDHMTDLELIFSMLGEASTTKIARGRDAQGFEQNKQSAVEGGSIAGNARKELEQKSGEKVISRENYTKDPQNKKLLKHVS